jgi:RecB family exonuclease
VPRSKPPLTAPRTLIVSDGASARLDAARSWLAAIPRDADALILASHPHAADQLVRDEVAGGDSRFGVVRLTPTRLAARLAAPELAARGATPVTTLSLTAVVTRAVHRLPASSASGRFDGVRGRPGFPHAVASTIEELREAGVSRDRLRTLEPWGPDLATIHERIESERNDLGLADRAELFAIAIAALDRGVSPAGMPVLLLDLPLERVLERNLIAALVKSAPSVFATAAAGDAVAIARHEALLGVTASRTGDEAATKSLALLQHHLFEASTPEPRPLDDSVSLTSWPGEARECVEIARAIQAEAARGVRFDRMAILLRAPGAYRSHVEEALRRAAIPAWFARGTTRPDPAGRAILALLACATEGLSARRFAEYVSLAQVPDPGRKDRGAWAPPSHELMPVEPRAEAEPQNGDESSPDAPDPDDPTFEGALRAPWRWERLLTDAAVIGGRERWRRRLDGLAEEVRVRISELKEEDARAASLARTAADLVHLREFALPIIDKLAALPNEATWETWLAVLRDLTTTAIRNPEGVLAVLAELEPLAPVGPVDLTMVQQVIAPRLCDLTVRPDPRPGGAVFVASIDLARGLEFEVVFVPGLAEKVFPARVIEDPLLPDEARRALGDDLATLDSRVANERLALRLAVGAASRHVALSWPRIDLENARPRVPSFYGLEAMRAAEGRLPGFDELRNRAEIGGHARLGWPAPERPEDAIDDTEYDLAVLAGIKGADRETSKGAAHYLLQANHHLKRALQARARRWLKRWTPADGLVDPDPDALAALARHQMGARSFSPTALENFSACPYRFLLQAVHRLQPREEAVALETIDPLTRGSLFHEVQFEVLTALRDGGLLPLDARNRDAAFDLLDEAVLRVAAEYEERLAPAIPRVWADGVNMIRGDLREWLRRSTEEAHGWVPYKFEWSFGLSDRARPTADVSSVEEPVEILGGAKLRGSVDLIERRGDDTLRVTDHKTGKARVPEGATIWGGQALQPVLYALAAEARLGAPVEGGRLYYCTADGDFQERMIPLDEVSRAHAATAIGVVGRALAEGFLPAAPRKDACRWCDYLQVCGPHEESRTARKPKDRTADLLNLRELP